MKVPTYAESDFENKEISCAKCQWNGRGSDANIIDFYGISATKEAHCPRCDKTIALVQRSKGNPPGESANELSFQLG